MTSDRRIREFLAEFRRLNAERAAAEETLAKSWSAASTKLREQFEQKRADLMRQWEAGRKTAERDHQAMVAGVEEQTSAEAKQIELEYKATTQTAEAELSKRKDQAEKEFQETIWTREAVYDAHRKQAGEKLSSAKRGFADHRQAIHDLRDEVAERLRVWGLIPRGVDGSPVDAVDLAKAPQEIAARLKAAREHFTRLDRLKLPGLLVGDRPLYMGLGLWTVAVIVAVLLLYFAGYDVGLTLLLGIVLGTCATILVGVPLRRWVIRAADRSVRDSSEPLHRALAEAEQLSIRGEQYEQAVHDEFVASEKSQYEGDRHKAERRHTDHVNALEKSAEKIKSAAKLKRAKWSSVLADRRKLELEQAADVLKKTLAELETRCGGGLKAVTAQYDVDVETAKKQRDGDFFKLSETWHDGLRQLWAMYSTIIDTTDRQFPDWHAADWLQRPLSAEVPSGVRFGALNVDTAQMPGGLPRDERLKKFLPPTFALPALLPFPERGATLIRATGDGRQAAIQALEAIMLRFLTALPPGKVRFTIIDPVGLGKNFDSFRHLADYDEQLVGARTWTEPQQIEKRLLDLTEHMENVIQKYLRGEYATIEDYNARAGEVAEPYRVLVAANFPANFTPEAARRLERIAANGAACGVYTLVSYDEKLPLPQGYDPADLVRSSLILKHESTQFIWPDSDYSLYPLTVDEPPAKELLQQTLHRVGAKAKDANRVEVDFDFIAPRRDMRWTSDSRAGIEVPLGRAGATKRQYLRLGQGTAQHALVAGKTGSGKSTLLHALITNLALHYGPGEIELYLIDFKKGVEFMTYARNSLPHARVIAVESEREFGLSVLQRLDAELKRRGDLFRTSGAQDVKSYRTATGSPLPRIMLIVDEFQEFFVEDDKLAQEASLLLDRLVRQGRAFGLHVLLGSQTLGGAYSLARSTIDQMAVRVALQCSETDANLILSKDNTAARLLSRPGEAIYNDANGLSEGNDIFQVVWLPDARRDEYLADVRGLATREGYQPPTPPVVFMGNVPSELEANTWLEACVSRRPTGSVREWSAWFGDAMAIKEPTAAVFKRQTGSNVIMIGQQDESARSLFVAAILSALAQGAAGVVLLDGTPADDPAANYFKELTANIPGVKFAGPRDADELLRKLSAELKHRHGSQITEQPVLLAVYALHRFRDLRKSDDDYGFGRRDSDEMKPHERFAELLRDGPTAGIHSAVWCDTLTNVNRTLERGTLREFEMRVLFPMGASDSSTLIDSPAASRLGPNRALFAREDMGNPEKFRPYRLPSDTWLSLFVDRLPAVEGAFLDRPGRVADAHGPGRQIFEDARPRPDDGALADGHAGSDEHVGGDPGVVADGDRRPQQGQVDTGEIVGAGTEVRVLADHDPRPERDAAEAVQNDVIADDGVGADAQVPRHFDGDGRADAGGRVDGGPEAAEQPVPPAEHGAAAPAE